MVIAISERRRETAALRLPLAPGVLPGRVRARTVRAGMVAALVAVEARLSASVPLMAFLARCGFPSPAEDYMDRPLDFNELMIANASATFAVRVAGDSMTGAGIFPNDIAVIDRSALVANGLIVLALLEGEFTIKRYRRTDSRAWLQAENPRFKDIELTEEADFQIWGVVTRSIRMLA